MATMTHMWNGTGPGVGLCLRYDEMVAFLGEDETVDCEECLAIMKAEAEAEAEEAAKDGEV